MWIQGVKRYFIGEMILIQINKTTKTLMFHDLQARMHFLHLPWKPSVLFDNKYPVNGQLKKKDCFSLNKTINNWRALTLPEQWWAACFCVVIAESHGTLGTETCLDDAAPVEHCCDSHSPEHKLNIEKKKILQK